MNIIKLKDKIMPDDMQHFEYFNKYLKGKYAYWVQMRYIVSFDHMRHEGYVACEEDINKLLQREDGSFPKPYGAPALDAYDEKIIEYIDVLETDRINNTLDFRMKNKYVTDEDITIDELKLFRAWLAKELLKMDQTEIGEQKVMKLSEIETHILNFYANDMYDEIMRALITFGTSKISLDNIQQNTCSCHHSSDLSSLYNDSLNICDPVIIYKNNIYQKMVEMFSNIEFWEQWTKEFIGVFRKYIDNIIKLNLPLDINQLNNSFIDCGCQSTSRQEEFMNILKDLSITLKYIETDDIKGHKNFINDTLYKWSSLLYEKMKW